jgi:hypothetical protein
VTYNLTIEGDSPTAASSGPAPQIDALAGRIERYFETPRPQRAARQPWEYQEVTIPSGQNAAAILNAAGADGWEAVGVTVAQQGGTLVGRKIYFAEGSRTGSILNSAPAS